MAEGLNPGGLPPLLEDPEGEVVHQQPGVQEAQQQVDDQPQGQQLEEGHQEGAVQNEGTEQQGEVGQDDVVGNQGPQVEPAAEEPASEDVVLDDGPTVQPEKRNDELLEDESKKTGTKRKTKKSKETEGVESFEPIPFSDEKLLSQRVFGHCCDQRKEYSGNVQKVIKFFHDQVENYARDDQMFILKTLWKSKFEINSELEAVGLNDWRIKDSECAIMAKMSILYKAAKSAQKFDMNNRAFCKRYQEGAENIVDRACRMYQSDIFNQSLFGVHEPTDRVAMVYNNLATSTMSGLESIQGKVAAFYRILYYINMLTQFANEDYRQKCDRSHQEAPNYSSWQ